VSERSERVGFAAMLRAGARALAEYTGTVFALFAAQLAVVAAASFTFAEVLAHVFATRSLFDEGVDGDLAALVEALRGGGPVLEAITWVAVGAILFWISFSWFLIGGLLAVLIERPKGRRDTARSLGGGAAGNFFVLVRLGLISLVGHILVMMVAGFGLGMVLPRIEDALTLGEVLGALALGLGPALLLLALLWTIVDYARVELVLRRPTFERLGATLAFSRAVVFVMRRPVALLHQLAWGVGFVAVSAVYVWASHGAAMLGASGAFALLIVRQGLALARMALKVAAIAGQVELGVTRAAPGTGDARAVARAAE